MERSPANLTECYQILGVSPNASLEEIKSAYRQLVKQYHPDRHPNDQQAADQFIRINFAYEQLLAAGNSLPGDRLETDRPTASTPATSTAANRASVRIKSRSPASPPAPPPSLTPEQVRIKQRSLELLSMLLAQGQWQQATKHAEALAPHFPHDRELGKVRAKAYHGWARALLDRHRYDEARPYLQKAMKADPDNRSLWEELERDYLRIERGLRL
jgi:tetratricopeptide (TPR) repeat protein